MGHIWDNLPNWCDFFIIIYWTKKNWNNKWRPNGKWIKSAALTNKYYIINDEINAAAFLLFIIIVF